MHVLIASRLFKGLLREGQMRRHQSFTSPHTSYMFDHYRLKNKKKIIGMQMRVNFNVNDIFLNCRTCAHCT